MLSTYPQVALRRWKLCISVPFLLCDVPSWSWGGWLSTQDSLAQCPLHVQRLKHMILQGDALLALLEIGFIQKFLTVVWISISYFLMDKGWCPHHRFNFVLLKGKLLALAVKQYVQASPFLPMVCPSSLTVSLLEVPCPWSVCDAFLLQQSVTQGSASNVFCDPCLPLCIAKAKPFIKLQEMFLSC